MTKMNVRYDFTGKTALVVGGAGGMGSATVKLLANSGANVMIADHNVEHGQALADELSQAGKPVKFIQVDVTNKADIQRTVAETVKAFGRLDYAANVVGISGKMEKTPFYEREDSEYERVMNTNVRGHWWLIQAETEQMRKQGGNGYAIVEVSSIQGFIASPNAEAYTVSKHATVGLVKAAGADFAKLGIRINGIAPVATATGFVKKAYKEMGISFTNKTNRVPRGTMLEPEECAQPIVWLMSEGASGLNATTIAVDGGTLAIH